MRSITKSNAPLISVRARFYWVGVWDREHKSMEMQNLWGRKWICSLTFLPSCRSLFPNQSGCTAGFHAACEITGM